MQPLGEAVFDWGGGGEDGLMVLPSFEDGAWWELCSTVFPASFANEGDNENWLNAVWWENDNNSTAIEIRVKKTMATDADKPSC